MERIKSHRRCGHRFALCLLFLAAGSPAFAQVNSNSARTTAVATAQGELNRARTQLQAAVAKVRATFKSNPQLITAMDDLTAARKDYDAARRDVIDKLKTSDPTYAALLKTQSDAQQDVHEAQQKTNAASPATTQPEGTNQSVQNLPAPSADLMAAAQEKLNNKTKLRNIEDKAVAEDETAKKAQDKLNEAQKTVKVWQAQLDVALKTDPDYKSALDQLTAARSRLVAAGATPTENYDNYGESIYVR